MTNKESFLKWGKVFLLFVFVLVAIISNAAVWNAAISSIEVGSFEVVVSVINFIVEIGTAFYVFKKYIWNK